MASKPLLVLKPRPSICWLIRNCNRLKIKISTLFYTYFRTYKFRGYHFLWTGVPNFPEVGIDKTATPVFRQQTFYDPPPHHRYTLPPKQAKILLKSVLMNKINTLSVVIL